MEEHEKEEKQEFETMKEEAEEKQEFEPKKEEDEVEKEAEERYHFLKRKGGIEEETMTFEEAVKVHWRRI